MNLRELCAIALDGARPEGPSNIAEFPRVMQEIAAVDASFPGLQTSLNDFPAALSKQVRVSAVMSDLTSVYIKPHSRQSVLFVIGPASGWPEYVAIPDAAFETGGKLAHLKGAPIQVAMAIARPTDVEALQLLDELRPLVETGRVLVRPTPLIMVAPVAAGDEPLNWHGIEVMPNTPADVWLGDPREQTAIPLQEGSPNQERERVVASLLTAYLDGVPTTDLALILDDEQHLLADFRLVLKELVGSSENSQKEIRDLVSDKVQPAIGKIEERFRRIVSKYQFQGATGFVATATAVLAAMNSEGLAAAILTALGATGLGALGKGWGDFSAERGQLRDMPLYLLWKMAGSKPPS